MNLTELKERMKRNGVVINAEEIDRLISIACASMTVNETLLSGGVLIDTDSESKSLNKALEGVFA